MTPVTINGRRYNVDLPDDTPLLWALRDELGLTGTKFGCGMALCGACTVHVDGQPVRSCMTPISAVANKKVVTIEAIGDGQGRPGRAGGVGRAGRAAVRLLSGRADHVGDGAAQAQSQADRRRHRRRHERQHLPLRHLRAHSRRHQAGRRPAGSGENERAARSDGRRRRAIPRSTRPWCSPTSAGAGSSRACPRSADSCSRRDSRPPLRAADPPEVRRGRHAEWLGATTRSCSWPSPRTARSRSSATAPRWGRACAPACR